jgi:hypothetical protein
MEYAGIRPSGSDRAELSERVLDGLIHPSLSVG